MSFSSPHLQAEAVVRGLANDVHPRAHLVPRLAALLQDSARQLVELLVSQGWDVMQLETLPIGVALPIREALKVCRQDPPQGWSAEAYALVGR